MGTDQPFMEIVPEVLRNYGHAVQYGHCHIYQALPRLLTIFFEYGDYCCQHGRPANNKVHMDTGVKSQTFAKTFRARAAL